MKIRAIVCSLRVVTLALALVACGKSQGGSTTRPPAQGMPPADAVAQVPIGQMAGAMTSPEVLSTPNPYAGNPHAVMEGKALYRKMNCAGCHAYGGAGNMGPSLIDTYWRYGGLPIQIYKSIHDGRPEGMPAWGDQLPPQDIWKLVAYIQSLGGSFPASDWQHAPQGDAKGENVAPEAQSQEPASPATPIPPTVTASHQPPCH